MLSALLLLLVLGLVVGFFAGLFGIGGGAIMVPALTAFFLWQGYPESQVVHMALATSLSVILFNSLIAITTHRKHKAVLTSLLWHLAPAVVIGSALASWLALQIKGQTVALIFLVLMLMIAAQMVLDVKPKRTGQNKQLTAVLLWPSGLIIGLLSALIAIGGGSLTVPFLTWHRVGIQKAIGTASALGFFIALSGTITYLLLTIDATDTYVYWPATFVIVAVGLFSTRLGANMTHRLPAERLRIGFAVLITLLAIRMYMSL
ncbi:sulfite exporter TauE/SafE family protein [Marinicella gelatinilytica]|uniref:sulfite exporter TauE/SafE family protein n=1 Tax=Marinicella gelatinilytica TaxID=2996017 RepID=UPI002260999A|nr:sulfite exporter TauE/SafE family protein [Marinicella gelatinilytica]MCX7545729.1 sulfite exporter TauE/SafE family protein [Marinicella gelatinilytica]